VQRILHAFLLLYLMYINLGTTN